MQVASYLQLLTMYGQILYWWSIASKEVATEPDTPWFIAEEYLGKKIITIYLKNIKESNQSLISLLTLCIHILNESGTIWWARAPNCALFATVCKACYYLALLLQGVLLSFIISRNFFQLWSQEI